MPNEVRPNEDGRAFLDFYAAHDVVPVHYVRDSAFIARRNYLTATLGVPPALIRDASVLEFGPGTGDNATVTASYHPQRYVLVDANPASLSALRDRFPPGDDECVELVACRVEDFVSEDSYDIVIAEGIIPGQPDPASFSRSIAGFVRPGGGAHCYLHPCCRIARGCVPASPEAGDPAASGRIRGADRPRFEHTRGTPRKPRIEHTLA